MLDLYYPFFSLEEITEMIEGGKDIWLTSKEINERVDRMAAHREQEARKAAGQ